jgi:tight adherence protein B
MAVVMALVGAGFGAGIWLVVWGLTKTDTAPQPSRVARRYTDLPARLAMAAAAGLIALAVTRWPAAVAGGIGLGFFARDIFGSRGRREAPVDRSIAVASWAEMLRDTLAASSGLEEAIAATAPLTGPTIRPAVTGLISQFGRIPLAVALASFAEDLADPVADLVVSALILAAKGEAQSLTDLLSSLAESARDEANMRLRVESARARIRTSVRVVAGVTITSLVALFVLNRSYLQPYSHPEGQLVLAVIIAGFAGALTWLNSMSRYQAPDRFLAPSAPRLENQP